MLRSAAGFDVHSHPRKAEAAAAAQTLLLWASGDSTNIGAAYITALLVGARAPYPDLRRSHEQAFAELNGANPIFVEDAVRLLCARLEDEARICDFRVVASHQESLHSHDAASILTTGETFNQRSYDPQLFESLHHVG